MSAVSRQPQFNVAGIPDVHRRLKTGQRLFGDGSAGAVKVLDIE